MINKMDDNKSIIIKPFGFSRNWDYIKINFYIMWRTIIEYKVSLYMSVLNVVTWLGIQFFLINIISGEFGDIIGWSFNDFLIFLILTNFYWSAIGIFQWSEVLMKTLVKGNLNVFLVRPIDTRFKLYFSNLDESGLIQFVFTVILSVFLVCFYGIDIYNVFLGSVLLFFVMLTFLLFSFALDSFDLISLGLSSLFSFVEALTDEFSYYPSQFFQGTNFKYLFNILPIYFVSSILVPVFRGFEILNSDMLQQIVFLFVVLILSIIVLIFNWSYGLKNYEAFG